jgi:hypothetical protein
MAFPRIRSLGAIAAVGGVIALSLLTTSSAQAACVRSNICNPSGSGVNLRVNPSASGHAIWLSYLNGHNGLYINCYQLGQTVPGPWGTSNVWDFVSWTSQYKYKYSGYVSDTYVYTGTNGPPWWVARCPGGLHGNF